MLKTILEAKNVELTEDLEKYALRKIRALERYIPRSARVSAHVEARLKQATTKGKPQRTCDLTLHLPHEILHSKETTGHLYAAIDIATTHLHLQITRYKQAHHKRRLGGRQSRNGPIAEGLSGDWL